MIFPFTSLETIGVISIVKTGKNVLICDQCWLVQETKVAHAKLCERYFKSHNKRSLRVRDKILRKNLKGSFNFNVHVKSEAAAMDFFLRWPFLMPWSNGS